MALSAKLAMRQGQAMVLTPQLLQAIKLLQMPSFELTAFIESELERNPLLDRAEEAREFEPPPEPPAADPAPADWASETLTVGTAELARDLGTEVENAFDADRSGGSVESAPAADGPGLSGGQWSGSGGAGGDAEAADL